ncbi:hypothetical protein JTB14_029782 [Gonioctena quinquepunctata]|nr:hypothetical protein JTB14_029782 [Gonioctena quinquepunctata]
MWSYEREQARLQEMLEILNDEEGQGVAYDEHSDIDQSDDDEVDHVEEKHDNSDSEQDISDDGEMVEESHSNTLSFIRKNKATRWRKLASQSITTKTRQMNIVKRLPGSSLATRNLRLFLKQLANDSVKPHLQVRAAMSNIPRSLRSRLQELSGSNIEPDVPQNASVERCAYCTSKKNHKTRFQCHKCNKYMCLEHIIGVCQECRENALLEV